MRSSILTVTVPATVRRLATEADLRVEVGAQSEPQASRITALLSQASAGVEAHCGNVFAAETLRETFRPDCAATELVLARWPVRSLTSITVDGVVLDAEAYEHDPRSGLVWRLSGDRRCHWWGSKIVVLYQAGFLLPGQEGRDLPHEIERATLIFGAALYAAQGRDPLLRSESVMGVASASYLDPREGAGGMPPQAADLLATWRELRA